MILPALHQLDTNRHSAFSCSSDLPGTTFGFCSHTNRLVDMHGLLQAAKAHALPGLGVCMSRNDLLQALNERLEHTGTEE